MDDAVPARRVARARRSGCGCGGRKKREESAVERVVEGNEMAVHVDVNVQQAGADSNQSGQVRVTSRQPNFHASSRRITKRKRRRS